MSTINVEIEYQKDDEFHYLDVVLEADMYWDNDGIGAYEFWGFKGVDKGQDYLTCEEITWDKSQYTEEENKIIQQYVDDHQDEIVNKLVDATDTRY